MRASTFQVTTLTALALAGPALAGEAIRFFVGEISGPFHDDGYVLVLTDPDDIAYARTLINDPDNAPDKIVFASVTPGADGINRNFALDSAPAWSWHVDEFIGFTSASAEIFDGWPGFIEEDIEGWIANTDGGYVGFWNYTITAELGPVDCIPNLNGDDAVDSADLNILLADFGCESDCGVADTNGDGVVDSTDLNTLLASFGTSCD
jgi:hypothetical protein